MSRGTRQGAIPSDLGDLIDTLDDLRERIETLEAPSGEALANTVTKLRRLVDNIQAQLDAYMASRYTNSQIDAFLAARDSAIAGKANLSHTHDQGDISGTWTKNVDNGTGGEVRTGNLYAAQAPGYNITGGRLTAWLETATGRLGYASSSERTKAAIRPADEGAMLAILDATPRTFYYRQEIHRRTLARINERRDYVPPREVGLIAEELEALGLGWLVFRDAQGRIAGIEYSMAVVALLAVGRDHERRLRAIEGGQ